MAFTARYAGRCARTGIEIRPGDLIESMGRNRYALAPGNPTRPAPEPDSALYRMTDPAYAIAPDAAYAAELDPDLAYADPEAAEAAGRYLRQSIRRGVSDVWTSGGREFYRNRRGLCEDAPCCGCCNA